MKSEAKKGEPSQDTKSGVEGGFSLFELIAGFSILFCGYLIFELRDVQSRLDLYRDEHLNVTGTLDQEGLIFNRVPKVGSETVWALIDRLAVVNNFNSFSDNGDVKDKRGGENNYLPGKAGRKEYIKIMQDNCTKPYSYVKHLNFINFEEFDLVNPVYINFVRDPVARVISWYYYHRTPWHIIKTRNNRTEISSRRPSIEQLKRSFEDCYDSQQPECTYVPGQGIYTDGKGGSHYSQLAFYCGHGAECNEFEGEAALAMAKNNVEKYYAVVGVLEEMEKSLEVLENYVPRFFKDARDTYHEMNRLQHKNKNTFKPKTPKRIQMEMRQNFTREIEFFEFCKQRLNKQYMLMK